MKDSILQFASLILFLLMLVAASFSHAGVEEDIRELQKDVSELKKELRTMKEFLHSKPQSLPSVNPVSAEAVIEIDIDIDKDFVLGNTEAPLILIEFSDYQCPFFCDRFFKDVLPGIEKEYITTGKVRYTFKYFSLRSHTDVPKVAGAALCAGDQGNYWEMHNLLFMKRTDLKPEDLKEYAVKLGLKPDDFSKCLDEGKYTVVVKKDMEAIQKAGIKGIPGYIIGRTARDGKIKGKFIHGVQSYEVFRSSIEELLRRDPNQ
ncbi:MAG: DsbA family protein [Nitrospirae bacterium]|nr:DsbA family protein [Nitrospirota bacterium]